MKDGCTLAKRKRSSAPPASLEALPEVAIDKFFFLDRGDFHRRRRFRISTFRRRLHRLLFSRFVLCRGFFQGIGIAVWASRFVGFSTSGVTTGAAGRGETGA